MNIWHDQIFGVALVFSRKAQVLDSFLVFFFCCCCVPGRTVPLLRSEFLHAGCSLINK